MDAITEAKLRDLHLLERQLETMAAQIAALRKQKDQLNAALNDLKNAAAVALVESADHYNRKWLTDAICQANAVQEGRA